MGIPYAEVIGDPVEHSKSPVIHKFWLEKLGIEAEYRATRVAPAELRDYLASRRADPDWLGCNVTMPHKVRVWQLLPHGDLKCAPGAVNCVIRGTAGLEGHNFDVDALKRTIPLRHRKGRVVIVGSGGAARAAREALSAEAVIVLARDQTRAQALMIDEDDRWYPFSSAVRALRGAAGLINSTPLGMSGMPQLPDHLLDALPNLGTGAFVYDMVYDPAVTKLIGQARDLGMATELGMTMLIEQAALSFRRFFGTDPPRHHDAELQAVLAS